MPLTTFLLARGDPAKKLEPATAGFLSVLTPDGPQRALAAGRRSLGRDDAAAEGAGRVDHRRRSRRRSVCSPG